MPDVLGELVVSVLTFGVCLIYDRLFCDVIFNQGISNRQRYGGTVVATSSVRLRQGFLFFPMLPVFLPTLLFLLDLLRGVFGVSI